MPLVVCVTVTPGKSDGFIEGEIMLFCVVINSIPAHRETNVRMREIAVHIRGIIRNTALSA